MESQKPVFSTKFSLALIAADVGTVSLNFQSGVYNNYKETIVVVPKTHDPP